VKLVFGILFPLLFFSNNVVLFGLTYIFVFWGMVIHTLLKVNGKINKIVSIIIYLAIEIFQSVYNNLVTFAENNTPFMSLWTRIAGVLIVLAPFVIHRLFLENKDKDFYLPSVQDISVFTFNELVENIAGIREIINRGRKSLSKENIEELLRDMPRHNSFRYINKGSLAGEYFELAYQTLDDLNMYIIVSNTGSPAGEIISLFTKKQYNHASLSFDRQLKTIISYNGGERLYPPGLNMEMLTYFNKKQDSSIMVYSIPATAEKKREIIDKIKEIDKQGNAYNLIGLVLKLSFKPNIMFCSQFVYSMLKDLGLNYFGKKDEQIKPADLIELDYYRKLKYEYEIKFNEKFKTAAPGGPVLGAAPPGPGEPDPPGFPENGWGGLSAFSPDNAATAPRKGKAPAGPGSWPHRGAAVLPQGDPGFPPRKG
jgi:hypothetical protein